MAVSAADPVASVPRGASPSSLEKLLRSVRPPDLQPSAPIETPSQAPSVKTQGGPKFTITTLTFSGNRVFSQAALSQIAALPTGHPATLADVLAAADRVTDHYRDHGYILARAVVAPQDVTDGQLVIHVEEGFIDAVDLRGETTGLQRHLTEISRRLTALRPLRLAALESELVALNRLAGVKARAVLEAAPDVAGASRLTLVVKRDQLAATYFADSLGSEESGAARQFAIIEAFGLTGVGARSTLTLGTSLLDTKLLRSIGLAQEQPLTLDTSLRISISQTQSRPGGRLAELEIVTRTRAVEAGVERSFSRGRSATLTVGGGVSHLTSDIRLLGEPISRDHLTLARVTANGERVTRSGAVDRLMLSGEQELGGRKAADISRFGASVTGLAVSVRYDGIRRLAHSTTLAMALELRWASRPQIAMREQDFGAAAFGRAFPAGAITGERGGAFMLELSRPLAIANVPQSLSLEYFGFSEMAALDDLDPLDPRRRRIASVGAGLRARAERASLELGGAAAAWEQNSSPSSFRVYFRLIGEF